MRMTEQEKNSIIKALHQCFDANTVVYLFGSRVDDSKKGGDIDLYIIPPPLKYSDEALFTRKIHFLVTLELLIGEQKIDVVIAKDSNRLIEQEALTAGIKL